MYLWIYKNQGGSLNNCIVKVPATCANLTVGFDLLCMAIEDLYELVEVSKNDEGVIQIESNLKDLPRQWEKNTAGWVGAVPIFDFR